jgi:CRISPR type III-A-associated protein Csm2
MNRNFQRGPGGQNRRFELSRKCRLCNAEIQQGEYCSKCREERNKGAERGRNLLSDPRYPDPLSAGATISADCLDGWANDLALAFALAEKNRLTKSQLRAFYGHVKRLEAALDRNRPFDAIVGELTRLKPIAHARFERNKIPSEFRRFIDKNVDAAVRSPERFRAFVRHFEAVAAYCEGRVQEDGKGRD